MKSAAWLLGALALQGCGAAARPMVLEDASSMLARKEASDVETQRPALVAEARQRLKEAEIAHATGDDDSASLLANIAIARYQTALNFVERDAAAAMRRARAANDEATSDERKRMEALEDKLRQAEARGKKNPELESARRAVIEARDKQAEAIREGAPEASPERYREGRQLVDNAVESLSLDQPADARRSATRAVVALDEAIQLSRGKRPREAAPEVKSAAPAALPAPPAPVASVAPPPAHEPAREGSVRALAEQRLLDLQLRRTELLGQRADEVCRSVFREFEATLDLAQKRFDARDYGRSLEITVRAGERMRACDPKEKAATKAEKAEKAEKTEKAEKAEVSPRSRALRALQKAQAEQAQVSAQKPDDRRLAQSSALIARAEQWLDKGEFETSESFSKNALKMLGEISGKGADKGDKKDADKGDKGDNKDTCADTQARLATLKKQLDNVAQDISPQQKKQREEAIASLNQASQKARGGECARADELSAKARTAVDELPGASDPLPLDAPRTEGDWKPAFEATQKAMKAREQARPQNDAARSLFARADAHLTRAKADYQARRFRDAETAAQIALDGFSAVSDVNAGEKPPALPPAPRPSEAASEPARGVTKNSDTPANPRPSERPAEGRPEQAPSSRERPPETVVEVKVPASSESQEWGAAYRSIVEALTIRDRITPTAGPDDQPALQRAQLNLGRARGAWAQKDYPAALELSRASIAEYTGVARAIRERAQQSAPKDKEALQRETDAALREAKVALEICERERCDDRDGTEFLRGKGLTESARKAADAGDLSYALELSRQARRKLEEVAQLPRKNPPPPPVDPKEIEKQKQDAEAALREADIALELCKKEGCEKVDQENWLRAGQLLAAARRNQTAGSLDQTRVMAEQSRELLKKILDSKPRFKIPDGITKVVLRDNQLVLVPAPEFERNNATKLTAKSLEAIKELAAVLKANQAAIKLVRLVGYTDNRGSAALNKSLSAGRARTIQQELVASGVPLALVTSEGRGPDSPIADNNTADGRLANRRVEIVLELK